VRPLHPTRRKATTHGQKVPRAKKSEAPSNDLEAAAKDLTAAIDDCDPEGVRQALDRGASLTEVLPDRGLKPLTLALGRFDRPNGPACAEVLIERGAEIGHLLPDSIDHLTPPDEALERVRFLLAHGGDPNSESLNTGDTALMHAIHQSNFECIRLLMDHGADPTILRPFAGVSAVQWLEDKLKESKGASKKQGYAKALEIITGKPVAVPDFEPIRNELKVENERFIAGLRARQFVALPDTIELNAFKKPPAEPKVQFQTSDAELLKAGFVLVGYYTQF